VADFRPPLQRGLVRAGECVALAQSTNIIVLRACNAQSIATVVARGDLGFPITPPI
jgi:hypothetical protein